MSNDDYRDFESEDIDRAQYESELAEEKEATMDPNETLRRMRELAASAAAGTDVRASERELRWLFGELDAWLARGGFLPEAWRQTLPETIHNMTPDELSDVRDAHTYGKRPE